MKKETRSIFLALSIFIGTVIGVGIFGVPYAISRSGFALGLGYLVILGLVMLIINYFYCDVVVNTKERHRLVGYARLYLGKWGKRISYFSLVFGMMGSIIAYIIVGGEFLYALVSRVFGGGIFQYQIIIFALIALAALIGLKFISRIEIGMTIFLIIVMAMIFYYGFFRINFNNLITYPVDRDIFLPYGVILFALGGTIAIPVIRDVLGGYARDMRRVVTWGTLIPLILTVFFAFVVVGACGINTSEEAMFGLSRVWGDWIIFIGALFGFLAVTTSFLVFVENLKESFMYDFKIQEHLSWFIACFVPFAVFLIGSRDFINVISFTGAIFGGINYILITMMYLKIRGKKNKYDIIKWPRIIPYIIMILFVLGILYKIIYSLK